MPSDYTNIYRNGGQYKDYPSEARLGAVQSLIDYDNATPEERKRMLENYTKIMTQIQKEAFDKLFGEQK